MLGHSGDTVYARPWATPCALPPARDRLRSVHVSEPCRGHSSRNDFGYRSQRSNRTFFKKQNRVNSWLKVFQAWPDPRVEIMTLGFCYFYSFLCSACLWLYFQCEQRQTSVSEKPLVLDAVRGLGRESTCPRQLEPRPPGRCDRRAWPGGSHVTECLLRGCPA